LKALVIGMGVGVHHAKAYQEEGLDVIVCDKDPEKIEGYEEGTTDYKSALRDADVVSVCTDDETHFQIASEALQMGKYVVIEKPPCLEVDEAAFLKKYDDHLYCNLPLPYHFSYLDVVAPYLIEIEYNWGRHQKFSQGWRANGYDIVMGAGLHVVDLLLYFKPRGWVDAAFFGANTSQINGKYDNVQALFQNSDGTIARISVNCGFNGQHNHRVALYARDNNRIVVNDAEVDKTPGIRDFVQKITSGEKIENPRLWDAMSLCFQMRDA
jgi:predicted dehydrogenase